MSFRLKTIIGIAAIEALLLTILIVSGLYYLRSSNEQQLLQRAKTTATLISTMTGDSVVAVDLATLDALVSETLRNPDIQYVRIRNKNGFSLSEGGDEGILAEPFVADTSIADTANDNRLDVSTAITVAGRKFGSVELGLSTVGLTQTLNDATGWMAGIAISEMILVALMGLMLGTYLTHQLKMLNVGAKKVADGDFGHQIPISGNDELSDTALSFNQMSKALESYARVAEDARLRAEAGRDLAEITLHDALDSMREGVLIVDDKENVLHANKAYKRHFGVGNDLQMKIDQMFEAECDSSLIDRSTFLEKRVARHSSPDDYPRWSENLSDGRYLLISQHPMSKGGVVVVYTDISELHETQEENRLLQLELMQRHKTESLATLAGGLAHEINTPVQVILDNANFLTDSVSELTHLVDSVSKDGAGKIESALEKADWEFLREEMPGALSELTDGSQRIRDLIATFKQFAAPASNDNQFVDLREVVKAVVDISNADCSEDIKLSLEVPESMPKVPCKVAQLNQALHCLVSNAIDAVLENERGGAGEVSVSVGATNKSAWITVKDDGCGIGADVQDRMFDALFTTKEPGKGTGTGLTLCQNIVARHHDGKIEFESELGVGSQFTIFLPLAQNEPLTNWPKEAIAS